MGTVDHDNLIYLKKTKYERFGLALGLTYEGDENSNTRYQAQRTLKKLRTRSCSTYIVVSAIVGRSLVPILSVTLIHPTTRISRSTVMLY